MNKLESVVFPVAGFDVFLSQQAYQQHGRYFETAGAITFTLPKGTTLFGKETTLFRMTFYAEGGWRRDAQFNQGDLSWNCEMPALSLSAWVATLGSPLRKELRLEALTEGVVTAYLLAVGGR